MKYFFFLSLIIIGFCNTLRAQVPQSFNYQAIARDKDLKPIKGTFEAEVQIQQNGNTVFSETHTNVSSSETGLLLFRVGSVNPAGFANINWAAGNLSLKINLNGPVDIDVPAAPIVAVPYAIMANDVAQKQTLTINGNQLGISEGNTVTLPTGTGGTPTTLKIEGDGLNLTGTPAVGYTLKNTGDTNPSDDLTIASLAGGDISGTFSNLQIAANAVGGAEIANGAVTGTKIAQQGATPGQVLKWNGAAWAPDNDLNTVGSGTAATTAPITGDGSAGKPIALTPGAANGQVLKWNGTAWAPAPDEVGTGTGTPTTLNTTGTGLALTGNTTSGYTLQNTGDTNPSDDLLKTDPTGGDVSGTFSAISVDKIKGHAVSTTVPQNGQVLKWVNNAWTPDNDLNTVGSGTAATTAPITGDGSAGKPIALTPGATNGQVLKWNGTAWAPAPDEVGTGTGTPTTLNTTGTGLALTGNTTLGYTLQNTGDTNPNDDLLKTDPTGGDVSGTFSAISVDKIKGRAVSTTAPQNGQVLKWNGTTWAPASDEIGTGGGTTAISTTTPGLSISGDPTAGYILTNTGDTDASNDLTTSSNFSGDVTGTYNNLQLGTGAVGNNELANNAVTGAKIAQQGASNGQVLKWNGTQWTPADDNTNTVTGSSINVGTTLTGDGTVNKPLNLAQQGASNGQVLKWNATNNTWIPSQDLSATTLEDLLDVTTTGVTSGQVLQWNGTQWIPAAPKTYTAGTGITIDAQNQIINTAPDVPLNLTSGGAISISGTYPNLTISTPAAPIYTAGTGINITLQNQIQNTGDPNAADDLTNTTNFSGDVSGIFNNLQIGAGTVGTNEIANGSITAADLAFSALPPNGSAGGDLSGLYPTPTVARIRGVNVSNTTPANGQLMRYNSTTQQWEPSSVGFSGWSLSGNNGTNSNSNFIGTLDNQPISIKTNNIEKMRLETDGRLRLFHTTAETTIIGAFAGFSNPTGFRNTFFGHGAGSATTTGELNVFIGGTAGNLNATGFRNTFVGDEAGLNNTTGGVNTYLGYKSGVDSKGNGNCFVGVQSGLELTSGSDNTCLGSFSGASSSNLSNATAIGFAVKVTESNAVQLGNSNSQKLFFKTNLISTSDTRIKTNIQSNVPGLAFIQKLRPVTYHFDTKRENELRGIVDTFMWEGKYDIEKTTFSGFLAQEVEQAARSIGYDFSGVDAPKHDKSLYGLRYAEFTVPLVKAVQEQQAIIEKQKQEIDALNTRLAYIETLILQTKDKKTPK